MSRLGRATLLDVARVAGVSGTTVSYILNGRATEMRISRETEGRVREAAASLGYRPNRNARSLRTAKTSTIGVITDFVASGMFASALLSGANRAAREADHLLVIGESDGDEAVSDLLIDEMLDRQVDGILYVTRTALRTPLPTRLHDVRTVMLNCFDPDRKVPAVLPSERAGAAVAADALLAAGVADDVWVVGEDLEPMAIAGPLRLEGLRDRFRQRDTDISGVVPCEWDVTSAFEVMDAWLAEGHRASGLVCMNDRVAMGVYEALAGRGLSVPDDVSVVSFDGSELAMWLRPRLTSVSLPFREMGALAVQLVLEPRSRPQTHLVPMPLMSGSSVRPHPVPQRV